MQDFERKSKQMLIHSHSAFEVVWSLLALNNHLQFMAGKTEFPEPLLNLLKIKLVYSNEEPSLSFWGQLFKGNLRCEILVPKILDYLIFSLVGSQTLALDY